MQFSHLKLVDMGDPPRPKTKVCSIPQRRRASRGDSMPSAHSSGKRRKSTWST